MTGLLGSGLRHLQNREDLCQENLLRQRTELQRLPARLEWFVELSVSELLLLKPRRVSSANLFEIASAVIVVPALAWASLEALGVLSAFAEACLFFTRQGAMRGRGTFSSERIGSPALRALLMMGSKTEE